MLAANVEQLRQMDTAILASDEFVAGELTFDRLRTRADRMGTEGQVYLLVRDGQVHAVTFTAAPSTADEFLGSSESIMRSYRVP